MPSKEVPGKLVPMEAVILGYGLYRSTTDDPWFTTRELITAMEVSPLSPKPFDRNGLTRRMGGLAALQYLEYDRLTKATHRGQTPYYGCITPMGEDALVEGLVYFVRQPRPPLTLAEVLAIPESVISVIERSNFHERLLEVVTGEVPPPVPETDTAS